jgi:hypothetical protein
MVGHRPMFRLAWFVLRAAFWLGLLSLFVPGSLPFETISARPVESVVERAAQDTLTPTDRAPAWHGRAGLGSNVSRRDAAKK